MVSKAAILAPFGMNMILWWQDWYKRWREANRESFPRIRERLRRQLAAEWGHIMVDARPFHYRGLGDVEPRMQIFIDIRGGGRA